MTDMQIELAREQALTCLPSDRDRHRSFNYLSLIHTLTHLFACHPCGALQYFFALELGGCRWQKTPLTGMLAWLVVGCRHVPEVRHGGGPCTLWDFDSVPSDGLPWWRACQVCPRCALTCTTRQRPRLTSAHHQRKRACFLLFINSTHLFNLHHPPLYRSYRAAQHDLPVFPNTLSFPLHFSHHSYTTS